MLNQKTLSKIKQVALKEDWDNSFSGKSKGNQHLLRTANIAKFLAKKTSANLLIVEAGALLHDVPLASGDDYDYNRNKLIARKVLRQFDLSKSKLEEIAECVASHEGTVKPKTMEAKIVHDADVLEKTGILGIIRHTWKLTNLQKIHNEDINDEVIQEILDHLKFRRNRIQTPLAKKFSSYLTDNLDIDQVKVIIKMTSKLANRGIITEKIALKISNELSVDQKKKLKSQLNLTYLRNFR
ncbi:HD domain-containing protein [Patescibacteria group bacterium]|nr:HD domain-containing protein [Patescibacteria group bacterium]